MKTSPGAFSPFTRSSFSYAVPTFGKSVLIQPPTFGTHRRRLIHITHLSVKGKVCERIPRHVYSFPVRHSYMSGTCHYHGHLIVSTDECFSSTVRLKVSVVETSTAAGDRGGSIRSQIRRNNSRQANQRSGSNLRSSRASTIEYDRGSWPLFHVL